MKDQARVLRAITRLNIGGPARQALLLSAELRDEFPTWLVAGQPQPGEGELSDERVPVIKAPLVRPLNPIQDARAVVVMRRLLRDSGAHLLHTHMAKAGTVGRVAAFTSPDKPRTVHTFHGHVLEGYFRPTFERAFVRVERALARRTDVLIAVSEEVRDSLLDLGIGRSEQFRVIPLGFDLTSFLRVEGRSGALRRDLPIDDDVPLVGILGRLAPIKDHRTLLEAMRKVESAHLAVLGDGELMDELRSSARAMGIADRVHFVGWRHDVADVISDLDVVALTSRNEGSPVSLIEALASNRPVVATDVGGVRSVVQDGKTGYLVA
ncbi:MAG: glycosyltransferase, partial [Actinomycetota bacterium]